MVPLLSSYQFLKAGQSTDSCAWFLAKRHQHKNDTVRDVKLHPALLQKCERHTHSHSSVEWLKGGCAAMSDATRAKSTFVSSPFTSLSPGKCSWREELKISCNNVHIIIQSVLQPWEMTKETRLKEEKIFQYNVSDQLCFTPTVSIP